MKSKKGKISPVMERVLIDALKLWQVEFIAELNKMKAEGKTPMFHEDYTTYMMWEFGIAFGIDELAKAKYVYSEAELEAAEDDLNDLIKYHNHHRMNH